MEIIVFFKKTKAIERYVTISILVFSSIVVGFFFCSFKDVRFWLIWENVANLTLHV